MLAAGLPEHARPDGDSLRFTRLSIESGLSQSTVYAIQQDRFGFMWFATEDGLNRYDGYEFKIYRHDSERPGSLSYNTVYALHEDRRGALWVGTWRGLNRYDHDRDGFTAYFNEASDPQSLSHNMVFALAEDHAGALWIGTLGGGLNRLDPETERFSRYLHDPEDPNSLSHDRVVSILVDRDGAIWVGTDGGGLNRLDPDTGTFTRYRHDPEDPQSLPGDRVFALLEDRAGELWVGTVGGGLSRYDRRSDRFTTFRHDPGDPATPGGDDVMVLLEDRAGTLWVGTGLLWAGTAGSGLSRYQPEGQRFTTVRHDPRDPSSLGSNDVLSAYEDRSGLIWIGTNGAGLSRFDPSGPKFAHHRKSLAKPDSLNDDFVFSFLEDRRGSLWIGTWSGGLNRWDRASDSFTHYSHRPGDPDSLAHNTVQGIAEDASGRIWLATLDGLDLFDPLAESFAHYRHDPNDPSSLSGDELWSVALDRYGRLWVGTFDEGVNAFDPETGKSSRYRELAGGPDRLVGTVYSVREDRRDRIWLGTDRGLRRLDPETGESVSYRHDPEDAGSLGGDDVMTVFEDRDGTLWVGTYGGGLNRFEEATGSFSRFTTRDGLPNDVVYGILQDDAGHLWLSTNLGLSRFDPRSSIFRNYDASDGLQSNEFNSGAYYRTSDGQMLFGGVNGFNAFYPERLKDNEVPPLVALTSFQLFNQPVDLGQSLNVVEEIVLSHEDDVVSFGFAALDYRSPERNRYAYRMTGLSEDWIELGPRREITFANLAPGAYTFEVKGSNNDGVWNDTGTSVRLRVRPPFWQTWWFRAAVALTAILGILVAHGARTRGMRLHNRALQEVNQRLQVEIQERERAQLDRERLLREMELKNVELTAKNTELEQFSYTVSHDLKSPLVTIQGFAGMLARDAAAGALENARADIEQISAAAAGMSSLLDDLLDLARLGQVADRHETFPLGELVAQVVAQLSGPIAQRGMQIVVPPDMPSVRCDRSRLFLVFQNLLENAIKFMGDQAEPRIEVTAERSDGGVRCSVRDNGRGIPPEYHDKVFGLFDRLDPAAEGTGVGLALVKRIVESYGGRVWIESEGPGSGTEFHFTLPAPPGVRGEGGQSVA